MRGLRRVSLQRLRQSRWILLTSIALGFLLLRLAVIPAVWPEKPPAECIDPPYDGCGFIFDEAHYVPAVRKMMMGKLDVNLEHPPLSKWIIWAGILLLGDNPWGWRTLNAIFSAATVIVIGLIAYQLSNSLKMALIAELLIATDVTFFNLGGTAILDPPALFFMALALLLYIKGMRNFSAIPVGLALLSKTSSFIALAAIAGIEVGYPLVNTMRLDKAWEAFRKYLREIFIPALLIFIIGLAAWDAQVGVYPTPLHHLQFMFDYHTRLVYHNPLEVELPLSWIIPPISRMPSPFAVYASPAGWRPIAFWGTSSPLWWSVWLILPLSYLVMRDNRPLHNPSPELILTAWFAITYGSFLYLGYIARRWVYIFYFLQIAIVLAPIVPIMLEERGYGLLLTVLLAFQILWFILWFPVKPDWLLELMGSLGLGDVPWVPVSGPC